MSDLTDQIKDWPRDHLEREFLKAVGYIKSHAEEIGRLKPMAERAIAAEAEAEHWKAIADSLEFGDDKPDLSPPPRADGSPIN